MCLKHYNPNHNSNQSKKHGLMNASRDRNPQFLITLCSKCAMHTLRCLNGIRFAFRCTEKQAGTGPSRRHIQGSKIAKRLPSVKYSLLQYSKIENFSKNLHTQKNGPGPSGATGPLPRALAR